MFLGALVGGIIGDKTGRRNAFILYEAIHIASMVVGAFSPNMMFLIACRFVMGVGLGHYWSRCSPDLPSTCPAEIAALVESRFVYWQLVISIVFPDCNGADAAN